MAVISNLRLVVCTGTATMVSYSGRNFIKDVSGFALCGLYYTGSSKGPIVVSPTQSVARYSTSGNYSGTVTSSSYVTINGVQWWYTPGSLFYGGNWSPSGGSYTYYIGQYSAANAATTLVNNFYDSISKIVWWIDPEQGTISSSGGYYSGYQQYWSNQEDIKVTANPINGRTFIGWFEEASDGTKTKISDDNPYTIDTASNITVVARTAESGQAIIL